MQNAKHSLFPGDIILQDTFKLDWQLILFPGTSGHNTHPPSTPKTSANLDGPPHPQTVPLNMALASPYTFRELLSIVSQDGAQWQAPGSHTRP